MDIITTNNQTETEEEILMSQPAPAEAEEPERDPKLPPPNFTGWWVIQPDVEAYTDEEEEVLSRYGNVSRPKGETANSHAVPAGIRTVALYQAMRTIAQRMKDHKDQCRILVLDPRASEVSLIVRSIAFYYKGVVQKNKLCVSTLRSVLTPKDRARGLTLSEPSVGGFRFVLAFDNLYYYTAEELYRSISPYVEDNWLVLAFMKTSRVTAPGFSVQKYTGPLGSKVTGGCFFAVEADSVIYNSAVESPDGVYIHPPGNHWVDYEVVKASDDLSIGIHLHRSFVHEALLLLAPCPATKAVKVTRPLLKSDKISGGVVNSAIFPVATLLPRYRLNVENEMLSFRAAAQTKVYDAVHQYLPTLSTLTVVVGGKRESFLQYCVKATVARAMELSDWSMPDVDYVNRSREEAVKYAQTIYEKQGLPPIIAAPIAVLSQPEKTRLQATVRVLDAGIRVVNIAKAWYREKKAAVEPQEIAVPELKMSLLTAVTPHARKLFGSFKFVQQMTRKFQIWLNRLTPNQRNIITQNCAKLLNFLADHPIMSTLADGVINFGISLAEALLEESVRLLVPLDARLAYSCVVALVEVLLVSEGASIPTLLFDSFIQGFFRGFFHTLCTFLNFPLAVIVHACWNFAYRMIDEKHHDVLKRVVTSFDSMLDSDDPVIRASSYYHPTHSLKVKGPDGKELPDIEVWAHCVHEEVLEEARPGPAKLAFIRHRTIGAVAKPNNNLASLLGVGAKRLDAPIRQPDIELAMHCGYSDPWEAVANFMIELNKNGMMCHNFTSMGLSQLLWHLSEMKRNASWIRRRQRDVLLAARGLTARELGLSEADAKALYCKIDELLKTRCEWDETMWAEVLTVKTRPIFPTPAEDLLDMQWLVPYIRTTKDRDNFPVLNHFSQYFGYVYCSRANANILTKIVQDYRGLVRILHLNLGDDNYFLVGNLALALDMVSCDLHGHNASYRCSFRYHTVYDQSGAFPNYVERIMQSKQEPVMTKTKDMILRLKGASVYYEEPVGTRTGVCLTAWAAKQMSTQLAAMAQLLLEPRYSHSMSDAELAHVLHDCLNTAAQILGFNIDFERFREQPVMPMEAATFLGGTFTPRGLYVPLKTFKALYMPKGVFPGDVTAQRVAWARVLLKDELAVLPIRDKLLELTQHFPDVGLDAIERYQKYLLNTNDWKLEDMEEPSYSITWDEWERQLHTLVVEKYYHSGANVARLMVELQQLRVDQVATWELESADLLFEARFGVRALGALPE